MCGFAINICVNCIFYINLYIVTEYSQLLHILLSVDPQCTSCQLQTSIESTEQLYGIENELRLLCAVIDGLNNWLNVWSLGPAA